MLRQPEGIAWSLFDARIAGIARQFEDFRQAEAHGAILFAPTVAALAQDTGLPAADLEQTFAAVDAMRALGATDPFGRCWKAVPGLNPPFAAVRVTGALFHTQGGLVIDTEARVLDGTGRQISNVFAVGGAACGVSGPHAAGYLSGNGLLAAVGYGFLAGRAAAQFARRD